MNVIKTIGRKGVAVGLSLALCASMVAPAFAAQVLNNENKGQFIGENGALLGHDGNGGAGNQYDYELGESLELEKTLMIGAGVSASIDLKGNDLKHTGATGSVISVTGGGELTLKDSAATTDEKGNYVAGKVTGGKGTTDTVGKAFWSAPYFSKVIGGGVHVGEDSTFNMEGGIISGNTAEWGGGIGNHGTVVMTGGQITNNTSTTGGGVYSGGKFTMENNSEISYNIAKGDAGGVFNDGRFTLNSGKITQNISGCNGGGVSESGYWSVKAEDAGIFIMNGGEISYNQSKESGGGIFYEQKGSDTHGFVMNGGKVVGNTAEEGINGVANLANEDDATINYDNAFICNGDGENAVVKEQHEFSKDATDQGASGHSMKCAHCDTAVAEAHSYGSWETVTAARPGVEGLRKHACTVCGHEETETIAALPVTGGNGGAAFPVIDTPATVEIEDEAVPLAGLFTRADAIGYLWEQAGKPEAELSTFEDVPADHVWAEAIGWAQDVGIAVADQEGNFRPDDLVLRWVEDHEAEPEGELEEFLNRYAAFAGIELDAGELFVELGGEPTDIVMGEDAQAIFDSFFAKLEEALEELAA